jgi:DNA-binding CsgD family transcriptional regulator
VLGYLVGHHAANEATIAEEIGLGTAELRAALDMLERDRLVVRVEPAVGAAVSRGRWQGGRWAALPPRSVLTTFLAQRRMELAVWERHVDELEKTYQESVGHSGDGVPVDVVAGPQQVGAVYQSLLEAATREVLHLARPPYLPVTTGLLGQVDQPATGAAVALRSVYESTTFADPGSLETALAARTRGWRVRLTPLVPLKLVIVDRKVAMLPAGGDDAGNASLVVHSPAIVGALSALFERVWDAAVPQALWASHGGELSSGRPDGVGNPGPAWSGVPLRLEERTRSILELMAGGLTDEAIAKTLDISRRTVQAEVTTLAERLGARTRFQIALLAAEQGLVTAHALRRPAA